MSEKSTTAGPAAHCTVVKKRDSRKPAGHVQIGWCRTARSHDATKASTRPTRSVVGNKPTPPASTAIRLSAELSRLSPITNRWLKGMTISAMSSKAPTAVCLKIVWLRAPGSVSM